MEYIAPIPPFHTPRSRTSFRTPKLSHMHAIPPPSLSSLLLNYDLNEEPVLSRCTERCQWVIAFMVVGCAEDTRVYIRSTPGASISSISFISTGGTDSSVARMVARYICPQH